jgi:predicted Zn-dependent protease
MAVAMPAVLQLPEEPPRRYGEPMNLGAQRRGNVRTRAHALAIVAICAGAAALAQGAAAEDAFPALLQQGFQLHQQAHFSEAISVLERARKLESGDYFVNLLLGIDLLRTGKAAEAVPRLKLAARARPGEEFPEEYLAEAEATQGHAASAAEAYQQAVLRGHNSEQALEAWAGFALERFHQIGEELRASEAGVEVAKRLRKTASAPESASETASGCAKSIPPLERKLALNMARLDSDAAYRLSLCYAVEAGIAALQLQTGGEDKTVVYRLRGDILLRLKGDAAAAEADYKQAIALRPGDPGLLERLAEAQLSAGETEAARQSAESALTIDPHRSSALRTLAALAMSSRDYDQALPRLRQLAAEAPGDRRVEIELGRALAQTGQTAEALHWLAPALGAGYPDEKGALHALLAQVLRKLGRDAEAAKAETEARRLSDAYQAQGTPGETRHDKSASDANQAPDTN